MRVSALERPLQGNSQDPPRAGPVRRLRCNNAPLCSNDIYPANTGAARLSGYLLGPHVVRPGLSRVLAVMARAATSNRVRLASYTSRRAVARSTPDDPLSVAAASSISRARSATRRRKAKPATRSRPPVSDRSVAIREARLGGEARGSIRRMVPIRDNT